MKKIFLYVIPELIVPGIFAYSVWEARKAEGWGAWAYGELLGSIVLLSGIAGLGIMVVALAQRWREWPDWHWLVVSAVIVGSPAVYILASYLYIKLI